MKVTLPYDPVWKALEWAKKNCPSYITNRAADTDDLDGLSNAVMVIDYYFSDEKDATLFTLKFK